MSGTTKPASSKSSAAVVVRLHLTSGAPRDLPPSTIQVMRTDPAPSCDSSYSSQDDADPILNMMNAPPPTAHGYLPRDFMPRGGSSVRIREGAWRQDKRRQEEEERRGTPPDLDACWAMLDGRAASPPPPLSSPPSKSGSRDRSPPPRPSGSGGGGADRPLPPHDAAAAGNAAAPERLLRARLSSSFAANHRSRLAKQQEEIRSILATLSDLQNNFVAVDGTRDRTGRAVRKEFAVRHFPNGDLFSGNVDAETRELIYGRMTCALEMEVYEGPFREGKRHGGGATCSKMDGGAKFLGR